jgi:hypothetical protein
VILRLSLSKLLADPSLPPPRFVLEDRGSDALRSKTAWYNKLYYSNQPAPPSVASMCAEFGIPHFTVDNCNSESAIELLKPINHQVLVLANTRIVKPPLLSLPTVTSMNVHGAYLPTNEPRLHSPDPSVRLP